MELTIAKLKGITVHNPPRVHVVNVLITAIVYLILCHFLWATNNIVGRWLSSYLDPFTITALRWVLATPVYPMVLGLGVIRRSLSYIGLKSFILGLLGFTLFNFILYASLSIAPATLVGLAYGFTPALIVVLSTLLGESRPRLANLLGVLMSVVGVTVLFLWRGVELSSAKDTLGIIGGLLAGLLWALYTVLQQVFFRSSDRAALTLASLVLSLPATLLASTPWLLRAPLSNLDIRTAIAIVWIAVMPGAVAYYMWNRAVSIVGSQTAAPFSNLLPVFVAILGYITLGERVTLGDLVGGALIVLGSTIALTLKPGNR